MNNELLKQYNRTKNIKLVSSIIVDLIGLLSYLIPNIGEMGDVVWAPISGYLIYVLFPKRKKMIIGGVVEEILPFTDIIPTAYLTWRQEYIKDEKITLSEFVQKEVANQKVVNDTIANLSITPDRLSD